jgi:hypothetical protein
VYMPPNPPPSTRTHLGEVVEVISPPYRRSRWSEPFQGGG